jgi:hypothetical protein
MPQEQPDIRAFSEHLLNLIRRHDGQWTWYQLARFHGPEFIPLAHRLMDAIHELETRGLIASESRAEFPSPVYRVVTPDAVPPAT